MINQPLVDYIRKQQESGVLRDSIENTLISQGWTKKDVDEGFDFIQGNKGGEAKVESLWIKSIPKGNNSSLGAYLFLVFGVDGLIVLNESDLLPYWYAMLVVLAVFLCFYVFENRYLRNRFSNDSFPIDKKISGLIALRNLIFLLNFIPFIQILGMMLIMYVGWIILIVYILMIMSRMKKIV